LPVAPDITALGMLFTMPTIFPLSQSKTLSSFLPAPPAKIKSYFLLNERVYKYGA
jgi:hypothetical protein